MVAFRLTLTLTVGVEATARSQHYTRYCLCYPPPDFESARQRLKGLP